MWHNLQRAVTSNARRWFESGQRQLSLNNYLLFKEKRKIKKKEVANGPLSEGERESEKEN